MKQSIIYFVLISAIFGVSFLLANPAYSQMYSNDELVKHVAAGGRFDVVNNGLAPGATGTVLALVPNIPLSFGKIAYDSNGKAHILPNIALGLSYSFIIAKGTGQANNGMYVEPRFIVGLNGNFGVQPDPNNPSNIKAQASVGFHVGFVGFAFLGNYDFITSKWQIGFAQELTGWFFNKAMSVLIHTDPD